MSQPLAEDRRTQILEEVRRRGTVRVSDLAAVVDASAVTLRRDIRQLAEEGLLRRVHGGAAYVPEPPPAAPRSQPATRSDESEWRVGMLVPSLDYYWPDVVRGAQAAAEERGVQLLLRGTSYDSTDDRAQIAHLINAGIDGILAAPDVGSPVALDALAWLRSAGVPVVLVERDAVLGDDPRPFESVNTDHLVGVRTALAHLVGLGHRRIGLVVGLSPHGDDVERAFHGSLAGMGLDPDLPVHRGDRPDFFESQPVLDSLLDAWRAGGITALLSHGDREAIAIAQHCDRRGIAVPEDLSIVSYDDEIAGLFSPPLTAIRPPRTSLGRQAIELMTARLRDAGLPPHRTLISPTLTVRESTCPPREPASDSVEDGAAPAPEPLASA